MSPPAQHPAAEAASAPTARASTAGAHHTPAHQPRQDAQPRCQRQPFSLGHTTMTKPPVDSCHAPLQAPSPPTHCAAAAHKHPPVCPAQPPAQPKQHIPCSVHAYGLRPPACYPTTGPAKRTASCSAASTATTATSLPGSSQHVSTAISCTQHNSFSETRVCRTRRPAVPP